MMRPLTLVTSLLLWLSCFVESQKDTCDNETIVTDQGQFDWPSTHVGTTVTLSCPFGPTGAMTTRECLTGNNWTESASVIDCGTAVTAAFRELADYIAQTNITSDNVLLVFQNLTLLVNNAISYGDKNTENLLLVSSIMAQTAMLFSTSSVTLSPILVAEITGNTIQILDKIEEWPSVVIETQSNEIIQSYEEVVDVLVNQKNFTNISIIETDIAFHGQRIQRDNFNGITFTAALPNNLLTVETQDGGNNSLLNTDKLEIASISLPSSIQNATDSSDINLAFTIYAQPALFPLRERPVNSTVGSQVISASIGDDTQVLVDPVTIILTIRNDVIPPNGNITNPRCVLWNSSAAGGQGNWSINGCTTTITANNSELRYVTCSCYYLTSFACLVDIIVVPTAARSLPITIQVVTYIGACISMLGLVLTIITLLIFKKLREKDASKFHIQLCLALFCTVMIFIAGIDKVSPRAACITVGAFIHYFALVTWMLMAAEALLMFQKIVIVFSNITQYYLLAVSIFCWVSPLLPVIISVAVDHDSYVTLYDSSTSSNPAGFCFLSELGQLLGAFLVPIFLIISFNVVIYILVIRVIVLHVMGRKKRSKSTVTTSEGLKMLMSFSGIVVLFGLTWLLAVFAFAYDSNVSFFVQFFLSFFNAFQGFFIFLFFVVLASDARTAWKSLFCPWTQKEKEKSYSKELQNKTSVGTADSSSCPPATADLEISSTKFTSSCQLVT